MNKVLFLVSAAFLLIGGFLLVEQFRVEKSSNLVLIPKSFGSPKPSSLVLGINYEEGWVTRVIDGDTIEVNLNGQDKKVRFVGMDTPETVDPRRPVGCFGKEASDETKSLLTGKEILMQKDVSETDKYGRLLRLVYLKLDNGQTLFVNDFLVREGFARVLTISPDVKFSAEFLEAQRQATLQRLGLWSKCS